MRSLFLSIIFLISFRAFSGEVDPSIAKLCENIDKIGTIAQTYENVIMTVASPVAPYTGLVYQMISKTHIIVDMCDFVNSYQSLDTEDRIRLTKNYTNTLTANKWDEHFQQADSTWNLANNIYDFESGEQRKGYIESPQGVRALYEFQKSSEDYYDRNFNSRDAESTEAQSKQQEADELAKLIAKNSIISEATNCPSLENAPNYKKIFEKDIKPPEEVKRKAEEDMAYYKQKILDMGSMFLENQYSLDIYASDVNQFDNQGVKLTVNISEKNIPSTKPGTKDSKGVPKVKKINITQEVQTYSVQLFEDVFRKFVDVYGKEWQKWVRIKTLTDTTNYGLFFAEEKLTAELRDLSYECREQKLMEGSNPESITYGPLLEKKLKDCKENIKIDEKSAENLIEYFVTNYKNARYRQQSSIAKIWNVESDQFGRNRFVSNIGKNSAVTSFQQQEVKCSENLTVSQMEKLQLDQSTNTVKLREMILKNKIKQTTMKQDAINEATKLSKEANLRRDLVEHKAAEDKRNMKKAGTMIVPIRGVPGSKSK